MPKLTTMSIAAVCAEIETGATVAEACRFVGVSKDAVYQAISRGAKSSTGRAAEYRAQGQGHVAQGSGEWGASGNRRNLAAHRTGVLRDRIKGGSAHGSD